MTSFLIGILTSLTAALLYDLFFYESILDELRNGKNISLRLIRFLNLISFSKRKLIIVEVGSVYISSRYQFSITILYVEDEGPVDDDPEDKGRYYPEIRIDYFQPSNLSHMKIFDRGHYNNFYLPKRKNSLDKRKFRITLIKTGPKRCVFDLRRVQ